MSEQSADTLAQKATPEFRGSLVRTVIISLVIIALLPAMIIGATSYFQFRNTLKTQTISQISSLAQTYSFQIEQLNSTTQYSMLSFASSSTILDALSVAKDSSYYFMNDKTLEPFLQNTIQSLGTSDVFAIYAVRSDGRIFFSSKINQIGNMLSKNEAILSLVGTSNSAMIYNPDGLYPNQLILISAFTKQIEGISSPVTFIYYSKPDLFTSLLKGPLSYFTSAHVFFITSDGKFVSLNPVMQTPELSTTTEEVQKNISDLAATAGGGNDYSYTNYEDKKVYAYIRPISQLNGAYVLEVPIDSVQSQLQVLLRFILILLAVALLLSGLFAFIGARQIAVPLVDLSDKARKFAGGDFSQKASVNRSDEIGLLASSFNYMVNQLATFYSSLEAKVADRTEQLRTASEIAQDAVSAPTTNEILKRVTQSIVDKLGFAYAAIYLVDKSNQNLVLTEDHSGLEETLPERNLRLPLDATSLIGWSGANRQARLSQNVLAERPKLLTTPLLPSTRSEIALPITIADRLIGVLEIQSENQNAFDFESMPAFTTLTNQIATGLRNIELLESTQLSLQETAVLYSATRAISQAQQEEDVLIEINSLFKQTPYVALTLDVIEKDLHLVDLADSEPNPADQSLIGTIIPFGSALQRLSEGSTEIVENFQLLTDFSPLNAYLGRRGCHSAAIIPVFEGKQLKHMLTLGSRDESPLTTIQMQPYVNLAEGIGTSLQRIQLSNSLTQKEKEITLLNRTASTKETVWSQGFFAEIHDRIRNAYGAATGFCVARLENDSTRIDIPYYCAEDQPLPINSYSPGRDLISQIINSGESILIDDASITNRLLVDSSGQRVTARSLLGLPLFSGNKVIGAAFLFTTDRVAAFDQETRVIFEVLASRLSLASLIDQQSRALKEIRDSYEYEKYLLDSLLENIPDRISFKNASNEFIRVSKSLSEFLGSADSKTLLGKTDEFHYFAEGSESSSTEEVISSQTPQLNHTEKWVSQEGSEQWVISNRIPLLDSQGSVSGLLSISNDITDLVKVRQLAEHRADQLLTASEIARESTAGTMDIDVTLARLVELVKLRFNFYHASIFLLDPLGKNAVLRESTGEAGAQLKQAGHKLAVGSPSIVGQATGKGIPVVIGDVTQEPNYFANPLLPETRSETAIPMKIGERVLGALDVQSTRYNAFSPEDINILQILANQTAVAVQNEDLFTHTNQSLVRHRLLNQLTASNVENMTIEDSIRATLEVLHQAMPEEQISYFAVDQREALVLRATAGITNPDQTSRRILIGKGIVGQVAAEKQLIRIDDVQTSPDSQPQNFEANSILAVPVTFADTLLGVLNVESTALAQFDENDQEFVTTMAVNMGAIISNIRLIEQVRDQVSHQQKLFEITSKIRRSVDIDTIMQTSISEIGSALNVRRASIQITPKFEGSSKKEPGK